VFREHNIIFHIQFHVGKCTKFLQRIKHTITRIHIIMVSTRPLFGGGGMLGDEASSGVGNIVLFSAEIAGGY